MTIPCAHCGTCPEPPETCAVIRGRHDIRLVVALTNLGQHEHNWLHREILS